MDERTSRDTHIAAIAPTFGEGDRCRQCLYWYWERDGMGWHSLIPITYADHPELAHEVTCPKCERRAVAELRKELDRGVA